MYESLMKILVLAENKDIAIKDIMRSFYQKRDTDKVVCHLSVKKS